MHWTRFLLVVALVPACKQQTLDLSGLKCDGGECLDDYDCHPQQNLCVPHIDVGCSGAGYVCPSSINDGDPCPHEGSFVPCSDTASLCSAGCRTCEGGAWSACVGGCTPTNGGVEICDNIDNDCNGATDNALVSCQCTTAAPSAEACDGLDNDCNNNIDDTFACTGGDIRDCDAGGGPTSGTEACSAGTCTWSGTCLPKDITPPGVVTNFQATPGDTTAALTWTYPADGDLAQCVVMRKTGSAPADHTDGTQVGNFLSPTPSGGGNLNDSGLSNGTTYDYAVFCRDSSGNWQDTVNAGNSASVTPLGVAPAIVTDFNATDGEDSQSALTFTMPVAPVDECIIMRKSTGYPTDHTDGTAVGGSFTGPGTGKSFTDTGLTNGTTYSYAVFCRNGTTWNDTVDSSMPAVNADTGVPSLISAVVTISGRPLTCAPLVPASATQSLMWIDVTATGVANTLTSITFDSHPNTSVVADTELPNAKLWNDVNNDGAAGGGDVQLGTTQSFTGGSVTFAGLSLSLPLGTAVHLILTADVAAGATANSYFAARLSATTSFNASVAGTTRVLSATPLEAQAHAVTALSCFGGLPNFVPGSASVHAVASIQQPAAAGWETAADAAVTCTAENCYPFAGQANSLMDCDLDDNGDPERLRVYDDGNGSSRIAHINTGIPLGLPICGLTMRIYASDSRENDTVNCRTGNARNRVFGDAYGSTANGTCGAGCLGLDTHYFFWYATGTDTSGTVNATGTGALTPTINNGPASANGCFTQWVDHNLRGIYDAAVAGGATTGTFHARFVADSGDGLASDPSLGIQHLPEIYIDIR